jgi:hypothetical protein
MKYAINHIITQDEHIDKRRGNNGSIDCKNKKPSVKTGGF